MPRINKINNIPYRINSKNGLLEYNPKKDTLQQQLNKLVKKYQKTLSIEDKVLILEKEREIIYQEIEDPNLTILRNDFDIDWSKGMISVYEHVQSLNITALRFLEPLKKPFSTKPSKDRIGLLTKLYEALNSSPERNEKAITDLEEVLLILSKKISNKPLGIISKLKNDEQIDIKKFLHVDFENIKPESIESITRLLRTPVETKADKDLYKTFVLKLLTTPNLQKDLKETAIWAAGVHKSDEAFDILKKICLTPNPHSYREKEFSLHSLARYVREKNEVKSILGQIQESDPEYAPLAKILLEKCNGNYNCDNKNFSQINNLIKFSGDINAQQKNNIMRAHAKLNWLIPHFNKKGLEIKITKDTLTKFCPELAGERCSLGHFFDSSENTFPERNTIIITPDMLDSWMGDYALLHELGHYVNEIFPFNKLLKKDFQKAKVNKNFITNYSRTNLDEFCAETFAQYHCHYKPHESILNDDCYSTVYALRDKNPELYKHCKEIFSNWERNSKV